MTSETDAARSTLATRVRSAADAIIREWRHALIETPWSVMLAGDTYDEIGERYLPALLEMVARQIERPSAELVAVYRDELCRYELALGWAANQAGAAAQVSSVDLIAAQRAAVDDVMAAPERALVRSLLDDLNGPLLTEAATQVSMLLLGDCLMNEIRCFLVDKARQADVAVHGYHLYFSGALSVPFDTASARGFADRQRIDFVGLSPFTFDGLPLFRELLTRAEERPPDEKSVTAVLDVVRSIVEDVQSLVDAPVLLHGASGAPVGADRARLTSLPPLTRRGRAAIDVLNAELARRSAAWNRVILVDEGRMARRAGLRLLSGSAIPGGPIPGALFHTSRLGRELADVYWEVVDSHCQLGHIRALAVDLDGTLWSGVMAEGEVEHFAERQVLLRALAQRGILLIALSKGSASTVRWGELRLAERDFAVVHRDWGPKADGLRRILQELDIRAEHVAVIDDNPTERGLLADAFPGLATFDPDDVGTWRRLALLCATAHSTVTEDARHRTGRYQTNRARREFVAQGSGAKASGADARMRQLGLTLTFGRMTAVELPRALELLRRTNQFNTTGFTPTKSRLIQLTQPAGGHDTFVAHLKDKFGDFGLVAVVIVRRADPSIESFVMSCRAMGYGVEQVVLDRVIGQFGMPFTARLVRTQLNEPCHEFYASAGFAEIQPGVWRLAERRAVRLPTWLDVHDA